MTRLLSKVGGPQCGAANIGGQPDLTSPILTFLDFFSQTHRISPKSRRKSPPPPRESPILRLPSVPCFARWHPRQLRRGNKQCRGNIPKAVLFHPSISLAPWRLGGEFLEVACLATPAPRRVLALFRITVPRDLKITGNGGFPNTEINVIFWFALFVCGS